MNYGNNVSNDDEETLYCLCKSKGDDDRIMILCER